MLPSFWCAHGLGWLAVVLPVLLCPRWIVLLTASSACVIVIDGVLLLRYLCLRRRPDNARQVELTEGRERVSDDARQVELTGSREGVSDDSATLGCSSAAQKAPASATLHLVRVSDLRTHLLGAQPEVVRQDLFSASNSLLCRNVEITDEVGFAIISYRQVGAADGCGRSSVSDGWWMSWPCSDDCSRGAEPGHNQQATRCWGAV